MKKPQRNSTAMRFQRLPRTFWLASALLVGLFWALAALKHYLLYSSGWDLGIFDQVAWKMSQGLEPRSTLTGLHHMGDHGAWAFYAIAPLYWLVPSVQWLFFTQALALILTAWPLWHLSAQSGLRPRERWLICGLWWLQPVVFNVNLFDFHPETWAMPLLALAIWANRAERRWLWVACLLVTMGCKAVLGLIVIGLSLEQALRRRWCWSAAALFVGSGWLFFAMEILFPALNNDHGLMNFGRHQGRYQHLGESVGDIFHNALLTPAEFLGALDWPRIFPYIFFLILPLVFYWRRSSLPMLAATLPLLAINVLSSWPTQKDLIHQYSLPLAVLLVVASMDGLVADMCQDRLWLIRRLWLCYFWATLSWVLLTKTEYFFDHYLSRVEQVQSVENFIQAFPANAAVLTHNYIIPHLSQRPVVKMLSEGFSWESATVETAQYAQLDIALLNPHDSTWSKTSQSTATTIVQLQDMGWSCRLSNQFVLCQRPQ